VKEEEGLMAQKKVTSFWSRLTFYYRTGLGYPPLKVFRGGVNAVKNSILEFELGSPYIVGRGLGYCSILASNNQ
jgi:hypothetical protein